MKSNSIIMKIIYHFEEIVGCSVLVFMVLILLMQVFLRYCLNKSVTQVEELARYCMIWMTFIGASYGVKKHTHVEVSFFYDKLKSHRTKKIIQVFTDLLISASFIMLIPETISFIMIQMNVKSPSMPWLSMGAVYTVFPIGIGLMCLRYIIDAVQLIRGKEAYEQTLEEKGVN